MKETPSVTPDVLNSNNRWAQARALYPILGREGFTHFNSGSDKKRLDEYLIYGLTHAYDLPPDIDPKSFIERKAIEADLIMNEYVDNIFPNNGTLIRPDEETLKALRLSPSNGLLNDEDQNRRLFIMNPLIQHELRDRRHNYAAKQQEVDYVLSQLVCDPRTETTSHFYSTHDTDTLRLLDLSPQRPLDNDVLVKEHDFAVAEIPGIGMATTLSRVKRDIVVVEKSVQKALDLKDEDYNGGVVDVNKQVRDPVGGIILVDHDANMEEVMWRAYEKMVNYFGDRIYRVEEDHKTNTNRGSALSDEDDTSFLRQQYYLHEMRGRHPGEKDTPIELIVNCVRRDIIRKFQIGVIDPETGIYNGQAEDMYALRRTQKTAAIFVPQSLQSLVSLELADVAKIRARNLKLLPGITIPSRALSHAA
jgi:hypothetical protein